MCTCLSALSLAAELERSARQLYSRREKEGGEREREIEGAERS